MIKCHIPSKNAEEYDINCAVYIKSNANYMKANRKSSKEETDTSKVLRTQLI